jgi:hypothetical protein
MAHLPVTPRTIKPPSTAEAIIPIVTLMVLIAGSVLLFGLKALDGPLQLAIVLSGNRLIDLYLRYIFEISIYGAAGSVFVFLM